MCKYTLYTEPNYRVLFKRDCGMKNCNTKVDLPLDDEGEDQFGQSHFNQQQGKRNRNKYPKQFTTNPDQFTQINTELTNAIKVINQLESRIKALEEQTNKLTISLAVVERQSSLAMSNEIQKRSASAGPMKKVVRKPVPML